MDKQDELCAANSTGLILSKFTLLKIRKKVLEQLSLSDQAPLRLVCKDLDNTLKEMMRNMEEVSIVIDRHPDDELPIRCTYNVPCQDDLLTLLERHTNVHHLNIEYFDSIDLSADLFMNMDITSRIGSMERLKTLSINGFQIEPTTFNILGELRELVSIELKFCTFTGENLGRLGGYIREIILNHCNDLETEHLLEAMNLFHTRGIPLRNLSIDFSRHPNLLPVLHFMLENFASLRVLSIIDTLVEDHLSPPHPLRQMLAVNLEELTFSLMKGPSTPYHRQFFQTLLAQPLLKLEKFEYCCEKRKIPFGIDTLARILEMCPNLKKLQIAAMMFGTE